MPRVGALHTYFREFSGNDLFVVLLDWLGIYKLQHCVGHNIHASRQVDAQASPNLLQVFSCQMSTTRLRWARCGGQVESSKISATGKRRSGRPKSTWSSWMPWKRKSE